jgi:hypothetical protein
MEFISTLAIFSLVLIFVIGGWAGVYDEIKRKEPPISLFMSILSTAFFLYLIYTFKKESIAPLLTIVAFIVYALIFYSKKK